MKGDRKKDYPQNNQRFSGKEITVKVNIYTKQQILSADANSQLADLEPGYAGEVDDDQVEYIRRHLRKSMNLAKWWGFSKKPKRATESIRRIALHGDSDDVIHNRQLAKGKIS